MKKLTKDYKSLKKSFFKSILSAEFSAVISMRIYQYIYKHISKGLGFYLYNRSKKKYNFDIHPLAKIEGGFIIVHLGGIVVGGHATIEENVSIQSCVTIGEKEVNSGMPHISKNCYIGTGAKILGSVTIGENSTVGANAVVLKSFPKNSIIVGIPAKRVNSA